MQRTAKLKGLMLVVILILMAGIVAIFVEYRRRPPVENELPPEVAATEADISIGKIEQTATRNGIREWTLNARSAKYTQGKNAVVLDDVKVTFYPKNSRPVNLTAEEGLLKTDTQDLDASRNVVVRNDRFRLETEQLHYRHEERTVRTDVPVKISTEGMQLTADSMHSDLNSRRTVLAGHVEGRFAQEDFDL